MLALLKGGRGAKTSKAQPILRQTEDKALFHSLNHIFHRQYFIELLNGKQFFLNR